jgi:hypothetical protein
VAAT